MLDERERHPAEREHERADPERRVAAHQRRDRDRVRRPTTPPSPTREEVAEQVAREAAAPRPAAIRPTPTNETTAATQNAPAGPLEPDERAR